MIIIYIIIISSLLMGIVIIYTITIIVSYCP